MEFKHTSVLLNETIDSLHIKPEGVYLDGTLGGGGHAYEVSRQRSGWRNLAVKLRLSETITAMQRKR